MRDFLDDRFLLRNETAYQLFDHIRELPVIDYHCHLSPEEIAENKRFNTITELWLGGDHYKWRLMRANGVDEALITGHAPDAEKFRAWCYTLEDCIGSPIYHWAHLELRRYFGYEGIVTRDRADEIYAFCNKTIQREDFCVQSIFDRFRVEMLATTDDPVDSLTYHQKIKETAGLPIVQPTFRPSKALQIEDPGFTVYIKQLSETAGVSINDWDGLLTALSARLDYFAIMGCRISDHSLEPPEYCEEADTETDQSGRADAIIQKALRGDTLTREDCRYYRTKLLIALGEQYAAKGWVMQWHMGAQRNNNTRMFTALGADTGFDSMSDSAFSWPLARLLDALEKKNALPKTILYALNPAADDMLAAMIGNFQGHGLRGKMQWGCPWWFNDHKAGIGKHLTTLANTGLLARFIGMLTDSRSFMSYPRHEYFRRILAQTMSDWVENGEFPNDGNRLRRIAGDIAYHNAANYFYV